jgi:TonB family protein
MGVFSEQNSGKNLENHAMNSGHGQNNSLATNVSRHSSETNLTTMQKLTSLIVSGSFCLWLLAGCATRNSSPASAASNSVPILVSGAKVIVATNAADNSVTTYRFQNKTPFSKYDSAIVEATAKKWDEILGKQKFKQDRHGKVVVRYHLHSDGTVSDLKTLKNNVGEVLDYICIEAIKDCAPFAPWPPDMVRMVGQDYREITFTFYYQ